MTLQVIGVALTAWQTSAMEIATDQLSFGALLRDVRRIRRLSQLGLSLQADVSQRHLSCLESGKARPSREMVVQLATALDLSIRERNRLLMSAGFAGLYPQRPLAAADMGPVRAALDLLLSHHAPLPAVVVDRAWNLIDSNIPMQRLLAALGDPDERWRRVCGDGPRNLMQMTLHPEGLRPFIANLDALAPLLLARTAREALEHPEMQAMLDTVLAYPGLPRTYRKMDPRQPLLPMVPTHLRFGGHDLRLFTMLATFGTPLDVTTDEVRVELFFPADASSRALLDALSQGPSAPPA
jgi:transcriptional regulator with XRE-family HTH domain